MRAEFFVPANEENTITKRGRIRLAKRVDFNGSLDPSIKWVAIKEPALPEFLFKMQGFEYYGIKR